MMKRFETMCVETGAMVEVREMLERTRASRGVGVLLAESGSGKTTVLRSYRVEACAEAGDRRPVILYRAEVVNTPLSLLTALLDALDVEWQGSTRDAFPTLVTEMQIRGVEMIVIDDAQRLARHTLDTLRALHERVRMALVLCAPSGFRTQLPQRCPQLAHRVTSVHQAANAASEDAFAVVRQLPTLSRRRNFGDQLALSRTLVEETGGNMRRMLQILEEAHRHARSTHRGITPGLVRRVAESMQERTLQLPPGA